MSRDREFERMMSDDPQPGMSTFDRNWNAANGLNGNGVKEPTASGTMLYRLAGEMTVRHMVILAGDKVTAYLLLNAAEEMKKAADEIERLREELTASHESHGNEVGSLTERLSLAIHERDEARRDRCMARAVIRWDIEHPNSPQRSQTTIILLAWQIADEEGWDCFKENTDGK